MSEENKELQEIKQQLREIKIREDLLFSVISNDFLSKQAMSVYQSVSEGVRAEPENEKLKEVAEKALESYKFHGENVNDAISYYYDLFGEDANLDVFALMKERGLDRDYPDLKEPKGTEVKVSGKSKHTSERVD